MPSQIQSFILMWHVRGWKANYSEEKSTWCSHSHVITDVHWGNYAWLLALIPASPRSLPIPGSNISPDLCVRAWCNTFCTSSQMIPTRFKPAETPNCNGVFDLAACCCDCWKSFREWGNKSACVTEHEREYNIKASPRQWTFLPESNQMDSHHQ